MPLFDKKNDKSFLYLNITQFLGALNDNIFKLLIVFMLINNKGPNSASTILSIAGAVFVIPFILFSSASGILADKHSKRSIIVGTKIAELVFMAASLIAINYESAIGVYIFLFLLATQSAVFGPSKYGIIPEIVPTSYVSKANGAMVALTFLAIIIGTFLASFITDVTNKHFVVAANICVIIAVIGLYASLKIKKTTPQGSNKKINPFFIYEIYQTLKLSFKRKYLLPSIFGSAFFLFLGGYIQLNVIPFAIQSLKLSEVGGGYLFLSTAIGIALGALIAGKISKDRVEVGLSCLSGFVLSILLILLGVYHTNIIYSVIILILLGVFGGFFIIPFDSFIQVKSPESRRGQIIATANFMSFSCVLVASFMLYFLSNILNLSAATGFIVIGILTLIFNFINTGRLSDLFFPYVTKLILKPFYRMEISVVPPKNSIIILNEFSWRQMLTLFSKIDNLKIITAGKKFKNFPLLNCFSDTIYMISEKKLTLSTIKEAEENVTDKDSIICLLLRTPVEPQEIKNLFNDRPIYIMKTQKTKIMKSFLGKKFSRTIFSATLERI